MGYNSLSREVHSAVDTVIMLPMKHYQKSGNSKGLVKEVITALPIAILRPLSGVTEAVSYTLLGMRNTIDPNIRKEEEDVFDIHHATPTLPGIMNLNQSFSDTTALQYGGTMGNKLI